MCWTVSPMVIYNAKAYRFSAHICNETSGRQEALLTMTSNHQVSLHIIKVHTKHSTNQRHDSKKTIYSNSPMMYLYM